MFRKIILVLCTLLLSLSPLFAQEEINSYEYLKLDIDQDIDFSINQGGNMQINSFHVNSFFYPQTIEGGQYLNELTTTHNSYTLVDQSNSFPYLRYLYTTDSLQEKNKISTEFIIQSTIFRPEVSEKIQYPLQNIPDNQKEFLEFGELIDIDENIRHQASQLAEGEDDVFIIAGKVAKWIREDINYDLSTLAENPDQTSSEVFVSKQGVCKEITNLYVSMMRSLGIPARVVSGYAYTTSEDVIDYVGSPWGGHAWAEVLIGDTWVPFDLTYNQYGYVDASHIVLDKSQFLRTQSVSINATGYDFTLTPNSLKVENSFRVIEKEKQLYDYGFEVKISGPQELGFGSYGYVNVSVTNTLDFYQVFFSDFIKIEGVTNLDSTKRMLILKPGETQNFYYRYKLPQDLDSNLLYTFPFGVYNEFINEKLPVQSQETFDVIEQSSLPEEHIREEKFSNNNLDITCSVIYDTPMNSVSCSVKNTNNFEIEDLKLCIEMRCKTLELTLNEMRTVEFFSSNLTGELTYEFDNRDGVVEFGGNIPEIRSQVTIENRDAFLSYTIYHYRDDLEVRIYVDSEQLDTLVGKNQTKTYSLSSGEHSFRIDLLYNGDVISQDFHTVFIKSKIVSTWEKFIDWLNNLF